MVRRITTGHAANGHSVVAADEEVPELELGAGASTCTVWASDGPAHYPDDGRPPAVSPLMFPPVGGYRIAIVALKAGGTQAFDAFIAAGMSAVAEPGRAGMHRTATTDFNLVLAGELVLELDGGVEVVLNTGDVVVQSGTRHRWINRGNTDAVWAAFVVGAEHDEAPTI
jgi:quercetin dioxygenase-like cupin family protein